MSFWASSISWCNLQHMHGMEIFLSIQLQSAPLISIYINRPNPQELFDFAFSSSAATTVQRGALPGSVKTLLAMLSARFMWIFETKSASSLYIDVCDDSSSGKGEVTLIQSASVVACGAASVVIAVLEKVSSRRDRQNSSSTARGDLLSLFNEKPQCPVDADLLCVSDITVSHCTIELIADHINSLSRIHRRLHSWLVDLTDIVPTNPGEVHCLSVLTTTFEQEISRVEKSVEELVSCVQSFVIASGYSLVRHVANEGVGESEGGHVILSLDSDGGNHMVLTSATEMTATIVQEILRYVMQVIL